MNFRFLRDLQTQPDDSIFSNFGNEIYASFIPSAASDAASTFTLTQAAANSGVAVTSGGITINLLFDAAAMAAPASFRAGIQQAASILAGTISDKITVNLAIDYSGTGGGAAAGPDHGLYVSYSSVRNYLINNATPGDTAFNALPSGSPIQGQSNVAVWNAQLKLWGLLGTNDTNTDDGSATFATDIDPSLLVGVALHELTHAVGRISYGPQPDIFDLFRFTSPGTRLFSGGDTAPAAYFSLDGGYTKLADYGRNSDPSDFLNSGVQGPNDPFNEYYTYSTSQVLTTVDKEQLNALGFHTFSPVATTVIDAYGSTSLTEIGNNFYLYTNGTGPELKYNGADVVDGQFGGWAPIGAEKTATGYEIAWKDASTGLYTAWNTDNNGNYTSHIVGAVSGANYDLQVLETSFHQDLNGDGQIGPVTTAIETQGSTDLTHAANHYFLYDSVGSGPSLKYAGADVVDGQFGGWAPIGAEKTATGYEIAWKDASTGLYTAWNTDNNGNYTSHIVGAVSGANYDLQVLETSFHQDLNGDGKIGPVTTAIETQGSTDLTHAANHYFLYDSVGSGPSLKYAGADVVDGQFGGWAPIGAEKTATGYEIAWKDASTGLYTAWNTDNNGNYTSHIVGAVSGANYDLQVLETSFHQDLNGDGQIGPVTTAIETQGSTDLTHATNHYFLYDSVGSGPSLKYAGADVVDGQFGGWAPIGAEKTATGYEIAWKDASSGLYTAWNTDNNGNYTSHIVGAVSGANYDLQVLETSFHQDLNGDGQIGPVTTAIETQGSTDLTHATNHYFLYDSVGSGPSLKYAGADVVDGQFGGWAPIGAEKTATGYEIAWKVASTGFYTAWNTDNNGNYVSHSGLTSAVSGADLNLQTLEPSFHQDLNGDGAVGHFASVLDGHLGGQTLISSGVGPTALIGGPNDILNAGADAHTFVFRPGFGSNTINGFAEGTDAIQFDHTIFADVADVQGHMQQIGSDVVIAHDPQNVVLLGNLHMSDFHFV